ncbi:guanosine-5'-triphosphate,3'-diphosphate diphosphatase [Vibrio sp. SS-MA-C1-2]|uniref:guanosine-5'-triphosphate,3'-diphosphate diphosphatase n=1 Tax=Vibrio sp. SS-MA-C1-2 TaxID=2908646 RepID=UPI001F2D95BC|nr:guanosine-5'-triphosphate,3'-diphosphate diphosphatase [Vibrio sp. SS-MA-C1-2]UJF19398.1 guanosine-5'-triphosphate,3'-diphosphate diphosphatase [Vibrio sp. SS-MA-C1-2]
MQTSPSLYVAIDLGSNSFHMLVVRQVYGSIQTVAKIKRKVRLAAGLDSKNQLSEEAMQRGWHCLRLFAERLQDIPSENIQIVGTAAMRTATNIEQFIEPAEEILGHKINVIPGKEEARMIYQGVAHTSGGKDNRFVVDIGGASTELIIGKGFQAEALNSLHMGCVTWLEQYFNDQRLTKENFERAITAAKKVLQPIVSEYTSLGWDVCIGASGTVQALQEIMLAQGMDEIITLKKLYRLQRQAMEYEQLLELDIEGLTLERALVFPSGLSILIAIFETFEINAMTLAGGAIREGIVYEMISDMRHQDICQRTLTSLQQRYQLDSQYGELVSNFSQALLKQCEEEWIPESQGASLLHAAALLHEIGMNISYKNDGEHSAYLIKHLDLPGFTQAQKMLLAELLRRYRESFTPLPNQHAISKLSADRILQLLRLSVILSHRRDKDKLPKVTIKTVGEQMQITLPETWLANNPLMNAELELELDRMTDLGWELTITS